MKRRWLRLAFVGSAGILVTGAGAFFGYLRLVEGAWIKYNEWDRRERGFAGR